MKDRVKKYLQVFSIEVTDIEENIQMLLASTDERHKNHELTEYVWTENRGLLQHELNLIKLMHEEIDSLDPKEYKDIDQLRDKIKKILASREDLPRSISSYFEKKMDRVLDYLSTEE